AGERERGFVASDNGGQRAGEIGALVLRIFDREHVGRLQFVIEEHVFLLRVLGRHRREIVVHSGAGEDQAPRRAVGRRLQVLPPKLGIARGGLQQLDARALLLGATEAGGG